MCLLAIDLLIKSYNEKCLGKNKFNYTKLHYDETSKKEKTLKCKDYEFNQNVNPVVEKLYEVNELNLDKNETHLGFEVLESKFQTNEKNYFVDMILVFQRLVSLCRDQSKNCEILCKNNVIRKLLYGFHECFTEKKESLSELQKSVLDLVTTLAKHSITPEELSIYFSFFKYDNPPLVSILYS